MVNKTSKSSKKSSITSRLSKNKTTVRLLIFIILFALVGTVILIRSFAASANQIYLSPDVISVQNGDNVTVAVRISPDTSGVDSVEATISYDQTKLQYVSQESTNSPFAVQFAATGGNGTVNVNRGVTPSSPPAYITADSLVANITFKALAGSGTSVLQFINTTNATYAGNYTNPTTVGTTVTLTSPPPPPSTTGSMTGVVTSQSGVPISGVAVTYSVNGSKRSLKTDANGSYTITDLPPGTYSVKFSARRYLVQTVNIVIGAGVVTTQNVTLQQR